MISYDQIFENNRRWVAEKIEHDPDYFANLAREQRPEFLYIGCSDSRVPASDIMGLEPGDVFVHRNIANVVASTDLNVMSVIEYAVSYLDVQHIIICGHYNCGGVRAAMLPQDMGLLNPWLRNIRDVYRLHKAELNAITDETARYNRLVELNVMEQCVNVIKSAAVQKTFVEREHPTVHGWVFDLHNGHINDLQLDFRHILRDIQEIYNLTDRKLF